jgi:hypothetical protein
MTNLNLTLELYDFGNPVGAILIEAGGNETGSNIFLTTDLDAGKRNWYSLVTDDVPFEHKQLPEFTDISVQIKDVMSGEMHCATLYGIWDFLKRLQDDVEKISEKVCEHEMSFHERKYTDGEEVIWNGCVHLNLPPFSRIQIAKIIDYKEHLEPFPQGVYLIKAETLDPTLWVDERTLSWNDEPKGAEEPVTYFIQI